MIGKSRHLLILLMVLHFLAIAASFTNALAWYLQSIIAMFCVGSFIVQLRKHYFCFQAVHLHYNPICRWQIVISENHSVSFVILPSTVLTPWVCLLDLQLDTGKKRAICVFSDALTRANYCALITAIKLDHAP